MEAVVESKAMREVLDSFRVVNDVGVRVEEDKVVVWTVDPTRAGIYMAEIPAETKESGECLISGMDIDMIMKVFPKRGEVVVKLTDDGKLQISTETRKMTLKAITGDDLPPFETLVSLIKEIKEAYVGKVVFTKDDIKDAVKVLGTQNIIEIDGGKIRVKSDTGFECEFNAIQVEGEVSGSYSASLLKPILSTLSEIFTAYVVGVHERLPRGTMLVIGDKEMISVKAVVAPVMGE